MSRLQSIGPALWPPALNAMRRPRSAAKRTVATTSSRRSRGRRRRPAAGRRPGSTPGGRCPRLRRPAGRRRRPALRPAHGAPRATSSGVSCIRKDCWMARYWRAMCARSSASSSTMSSPLTSTVTLWMRPGEPERARVLGRDRGARRSARSDSAPGSGRTGWSPVPRRADERAVDVELEPPRRPPAVRHVGLARGLELEAQLVRARPAPVPRTSRRGSRDRPSCGRSGAGRP